MCRLVYRYRVSQIEKLILSTCQLCTGTDTDIHYLFIYALPYPPSWWKWWDVKEGKLLDSTQFNCRFHWKTLTNGQDCIYGEKIEKSSRKNSFSTLHDFLRAHFWNATLDGLVFRTWIWNVISKSIALSEICAIKVWKC